MKIALILVLLFVTPCLAEEIKPKEPRSLLELILESRNKKFMTPEEKSQIVSDVKSEFNLKDEDLAFIFSVRGARLPYDGFDFFEEPQKLMQLATLYLEAKEAWGKIISVDFYDFFKSYASDRTKTAQQAIEKHFQLNEAKKRFKLPY